jgi:integrase
MRIKWNRSKYIVSVSLPIKIDTTKWDKTKQRCKSNTFHFGISSTLINKEISEYENKVNELFYKLNSTPNKEYIKQQLSIIAGKKELSNLNELTTVSLEFIKNYSQKNDLSETTSYNYKYLFKKLTEFGIKYIEDFEKFVPEDFHKFLTEKQYNNSYILNIINRLKTFLKWLNKYKNTNFDTNFDNRIKLVNNDIVYLDWSELMRIYETDFEDESLNYTRDVFCFCSFTSLRISDAIKLNKKEINNDYILIITKKTSKPLKIELNKYSKSILLKYKNIDYPFSHFSKDLLNRNIKKIGKICGIDTPMKRISYSGNVRNEITVPKYQLLSTHCGRRTFVVHCIRLGIPVEIIMRWTGHKNYNTLKSYVDIVDELKKSSMNKFNTD